MDNNLYKTEEINLSIRNLDVKILRITNIDELFDALIAKGDTHEDVKDERIPYWADLWASSIGMCNYLIDNQVVTHDKIVTEIGAGLALPSIVAGKIGAKKINITDYLQEPLAFAQKNWQLNNPSSESVNFEILDWRNPILSLSADVLLASDVAYERRTLDYLPSVFKSLCNPNGKIIVSEPNRPVSQNFFNNLDKFGFKSKKTSYQIPLNGMSHTVNVFEIENQ